MRSAPKRRLCYRLMVPATDTCASKGGIAVKPMNALAALSFAFVTGAAASLPAPANAAWGPPNPQIEIDYVVPKDARYRPFYDKLKKRQVLEELQSFLSPL